MKTIKSSFQSDKINIDKIPTNRSIAVAIKSLIVIFLLSLIILLPSCTVIARTPVYDSYGVVIRNHNRNERHNHRDNCECDVVHFRGPRD